MKKRLINRESLHRILNSLLTCLKHDDTEEYGLSIMPILQNLMQAQKSGMYIPGETIKNERQRIKIIQHGVIPVMIHGYQTTKIKELKELFNSHLTKSFQIEDFRWTLKELKVNQGFTDGNNEFQEDIQTKEILPLCNSILNN